MAMFSTIALASRGRIVPSGVKRSIAMATLGWILISSGPIPPQPVEPAQSASAGGGGGGMMRWDLKRIQNDDDEILAMIKIWVQCN